MTLVTLGLMRGAMRGTSHRMRFARIALAVLSVLVGCTSEGDGMPDGALAVDASSVERHDAGDAGLDAGEPRDDASARRDASALDAAHLLDDAGEERDAMLPALEDLPYVRSVVSFNVGTTAGFGQANFPDIVFGPPKGKASGGGSLDVLSLGVGGEIEVAFGDYEIVDGDGPDFIVFENSFWAGADETTVFAELGEVSVSEDGVTWHSFACDTSGGGTSTFAGCAGWTPTASYDAQRVFPLDPALTGGDGFDLEALGLTRARYVRIRDLGTQPAAGNSGGFDLDAVGLVHYARSDDARE